MRMVLLGSLLLLGCSTTADTGSSSSSSVTPLLVGGPRGQLFGNLVQSQFQKAMNWPLGSALSLMMLLVAVPVMLLLARSGRLDLGEG